MILFQLIFSFLQVGLFSIGGGYAAMPLIQEQVVSVHPWLSMQEFTDLITIAEMTPGPIAVNSATFVGMRIAGVPGAIGATAGCILPSCLIVSLLSFIYQKYKKLAFLQNVLSCLRPAVVALIAGAGWSIFLLVLQGGSASFPGGINVTGILLFIAGLLLLRLKKWNPILVMVLCGVVYTGVQLVLA